MSTTTSPGAVVVADGASGEVTVNGTPVAVAVVRIADQVVLDVREGTAPTAAASISSGHTVALGGSAVRVTAHPKASDYDPATVSFDVVGGPSDVTPAVPAVTGSPGTPVALAPTTQTSVQLGSERATLGVVNSGRNAIVLGFQVAGGPSGVHHLVSGDVTALGSHVVKVESDGTTVTVTPYA